MKNLYITLSALSLSLHIEAASFDCNQAKTKIENEICSNRKISDLDSILSKQYKNALNAASDPNRIKIEQRKWIKNIRNKCTEKNCLQETYELRIRQLAPSSGTFDSLPITEICNDILSRFHEGTLKSSFEKFSPATTAEKNLYGKSNNFSYLHETINLKINEIDRKFLSINTAGTCGSGYIVDSKYQAEESLENVTNENLRWAHWGNYDSLLLIQGRPILVTGNFFNKNTITLASFLDETGKRYPLCDFSAEKETQAFIIKSEDDNLCNKVRSQSIHNIVDIKQNTKIKSEAPHDGGLGIPRIRTASIDLDNDGKPNLIGVYEYDSTAGCGSFVQRLRSLNEDTLKEEPSDLNNILQNGMFQHSSWGPILGVTYDSWWHSLQLFTYDNKAFLLAAKEGSNAAVYSFWQNEKKEWCDFKIIPKHTITTYYNIDNKKETLPAGILFRFDKNFN